MPAARRCRRGMISRCSHRFPRVLKLRSELFAIGEGIEDVCHQFLWDRTPRPSSAIKAIGLVYAKDSRKQAGLRGHTRLFALNPGPNGHHTTYNRPGVSVDTEAKGVLEKSRPARFRLASPRSCPTNLDSITLGIEVSLWPLLWHWPAPDSFRPGQIQLTTAEKLLVSARAGSLPLTHQAVLSWPRKRMTTIVRSSVCSILDISHRYAWNIALFQPFRQVRIDFSRGHLSSLPWSARWITRPPVP